MVTVSSGIWFIYCNKNNNTDIQEILTGYYVGTGNMNSYNNDWLNCARDR